MINTMKSERRSTHGWTLGRVRGMCWTIWRRANKELVRHYLSTVCPQDKVEPRLERLGSDYGGWYVPTDLMDESWVCYCVGVGRDATFDIELARRFDAEVHCFDPTPASISYMDEINCEKQGLHYHPIGLWREDQTLRFFVPASGSQFSHSVHDLNGTGDYFEAECKRLSTIARELGHERVNLLKIDIEGAWWSVIRGLDHENIEIDVLCAEFDSPTSLVKVSRAIRFLRRIGFKFIHREKENYLFVHERLLDAKRLSPEPDRTGKQRV